MRTLDPEHVSIGYLLPTRDAITLERPEDGPLLRRNIERCYGHPLELIQAIQAMYAGTPEGMAEWLRAYVRAGARHIVLRVSDEDAERGLGSAGQARGLIAGAVLEPT